MSRHMMPTVLRKASEPATTPAARSAWPFRYLVALSSTTSMPSSEGLHTASVSTAHSSGGSMQTRTTESGFDSFVCPRHK